MKRLKTGNILGKTLKGLTEISVYLILLKSPFKVKVKKGLHFCNPFESGR